MDFYIFDKTESLLRVRNDALEAIHTEEEYRLDCTFPLTDFLIERGMYVGFYDIQDIFQMFEVREVHNSDPGMEQEISCEHIALADLSDEIVEDVSLTNVTADTAAAAMLADTRWAVGDYVSSDPNGIKAYYETAWAKLCEIRGTWGVKFQPRIVLTGREITGRYIDIISAAPVNRGVRIEISKSLESIGVVYDDRSLFTALYGRGQGLSTLVGDETNDAKVTFEDAIWTIAGGDPADKPEGQKWVEDVDATTLYGRNGRRRAGVIEFPDIDNADNLLQATWDALQIMKYPKITIECAINVLSSYGYSGQLMLLGDEVAVIDDNLGLELQATVVKMPRDLLHWEETKPTIGYYRGLLDYMVSETMSATGTVYRITNSNPDIVNGFVTNVNGATGTFNEIVQKSPTNATSRIYIGEYNNKGDNSDPHSGVFWGGQKAQFVAVDSNGILNMAGESGLMLLTTIDGGPLILHSMGDIHFIPGAGYHVYADGTQLD